MNGVMRMVQYPIALFCDNSGVVAQSKESKNHKRRKHIEHKYHLIREIVTCGDVVVVKIASTEKSGKPFH
jgi:hypothetical protein